jgi:hypothetical protein
VVSRSGELPANFDDAPAQLRSQLGLLLGEHMELTVDATRAVVTGGDDATAAAGALQGNTADIAKAFGSVFGTEGSRALVQLWADHVDAVVAFAVATARKDAAGTTKARAALDRAARGLGAEFSRLAKGKVAVRAATQALDQHDQQLLTQITAYAQADYGKAHEISYGGYQHMFMIAGVLADAIGANVAAKLPRGGAATGGGGLAGTRGGAGFVAGNTALVP